MGKITLLVLSLLICSIFVNAQNFEKCPRIEVNLKNQIPLRNMPEVSINAFSREGPPINTTVYLTLSQDLTYFESKTIVVPAEGYIYDTSELISDLDNLKEGEYNLRVSSAVDGCKNMINRVFTIKDSNIFVRLWFFLFKS